jgi:hypothetical protein
VIDFFVSINTSLSDPRSHHSFSLHLMPVIVRGPYPVVSGWTRIAGAYPFREWNSPDSEYFLSSQVTKSMEAIVPTLQ